jgi:pullulanase/glycogen debranching enzyme
MIHSGQEYARSKVIAPTPAPDPDVGKIDHNSYNKDNETNWLNFDHAGINRELMNYYKGLIALRKAHPAFRQASQSAYTFPQTTDSIFVRLNLSYDGSEYLVLLNGNRTEEQTVELPAGTWGVLADGQKAAARPFRELKDKNLILPASSGMVLVK